jgi:formate dehydrogenase iron-sulfur subunit
MERMAILVDVTKCTGCGSCAAACQDVNEQKWHEALGFNAETFTFVVDRGDNGNVRRLCMHCEDPTCASVCPVGALRKTAAGPVTYDADRCMGCRYCIVACPFAVPTYEWSSSAPRVRKCQMCAGRPEGPACAEECPEGATIAGPRDALIAEARRRLAEEPKRYFPYIYGLVEVGGTDVLYIGAKSPAELGLPTNLGSHPLPALTWSALKHVPDVATFGGATLAGLLWFTRRKERVAAAEKKPTQPTAESEDDHGKR